MNCCYPDVVNGMIAAAGLPITCGIGNVAILAHAFVGLLGPGHGRLQLLAQHAALSAFRRPAADRAASAAPRVWQDGKELDHVMQRFAPVQLALEPVIDISGASGVPLFLAMIAGTTWHGHVPGPSGLPGGYPVVLHNGALDLDLPPGLSRDAAIDWNAAFERRDGVAVSADGCVRYSGRVERTLSTVSPDIADGFMMRDFAAADAALTALRERLRNTQRVLCKKFSGLVAEALPASAAGNDIEVWFSDAATVGQKGSLEYVWAPIGSRPPMVRDNRHGSVHLFGAICPGRGVGAAIIMPAVYTEAMNEHLKEISTQVSPGAHAVLVCDGAGWHQPGKRLCVPDNITLLPLPPYASELNPMENVWDYLRGNKLSSLVWDSSEAIVRACKDAWYFFVNDPERIVSIGTRHWASVKG